jgi:hypothetical protein
MEKPKQRPPMAVALDETVRALYPTFRAMIFKELGERFEELAEGRETIPVAEVRISLCSTRKCGRCSCLTTRMNDRNLRIRGDLPETLRP